MFIRKLLLIVFLYSYCFFLYAQEKIIKSGDQWRYYDEKVAPEMGWQNSKAITSNWKLGISGLGYGDSAATSEISFGEDPENKYLAAYFFKDFTMLDPFEFIIYQINVKKDDGVVLYLNGKEIFRKDMPLGEIKHDTEATSLIVSGKIESFYHPIFISPEDLNSGENIISASVHQGRKNSEDLFFNLELIGHNDVRMLPFLLKERTIKNLNLDLKIKDLTHKQEVEKKDFQYQLLKQQNNNFKSFSIILALLLLTLLIYVWFRHNDFNIKRKRLVEDKESLTEMIKNKDTEMMNISLNSLHNNQFLKVIKKNLEDNVNGKDLSSLKKEINRTINNIEYNLDFNKDWETLKKHFNAVYSGFVDKLSKLHPTLTDIEIRHCIFIKLHLQTKEIAKMLHIDPRSVQSSRYRLKKKMNLDETMDLKDYLNNIELD